MLCANPEIQGLVSRGYRVRSRQRLTRFDSALDLAGAVRMRWVDANRPHKRLYIRTDVCLTISEFRASDTRSIVVQAIWRKSSRTANCQGTAK